MKKLFGTDGIRGPANMYPLTIDACFRLSEVLVKKFCASDAGKVVLIGKDTRISCDMFEHAIASALSSFGVDVRLIGVCPTPAVSILTEIVGANFGIMISASHNKFSDNGIKIFNGCGLKLLDAEEEEIESMIFDSDIVCKKMSGEKIGKIQSDSALIRVYNEKVISKFSFLSEEISNFKIVVDAANGSFSAIAPDILQNFGFDVISINNSPNGININDECGVMYPKVISSETLKHKANIGIAFDGDGDRLLLSDETGTVIDGDHILAALVEAYSLYDTEIASTIISNFAFERYLKTKKIQLVRTNVGDRYISEYMRKHTTKIGGEPSGHIIIKDQALTGDGLFAAIKILEYLIRSRKKASEINKIFTSCPAMSKNVEVKDKSIIFQNDIQQLIRKCNDELWGKGKLIVRPSGTESIIRISAEGEDEHELHRIVDELYSMIEEASK